MKKKVFDVSRETLREFLRSCENFAYLYSEFSRDLNRNFKFTVNGKFVGFSGLLLSIQKSMNCSLDLAMVFMRDVYNKAMRSTNEIYKFSAFCLNLKFYAK